MQNDQSRMGENSFVEINYPSKHNPACEGIHWNCDWKIEKYNAGIDDVRAGTFQSSTAGSKLGQPVRPYEVVNGKDNLLLRGGADLLWLGLKAGLTATTGAKNTYLNNAEAVIFVGNSNTAAANTQVDLQASSSRRFAKGMEATYPTHTTGDGSTAALNIAFRSVFSTAQANFAWEEWGVGNSTKSTAPYPGRLLNRKVQSLGTKSTAATWTFTVTLSLS
jgi:hypothetical protein